MPNLLDRLWSWIALALGTGLGIGLLSRAPGTLGSLLGPLLVWGLRSATPSLEIQALFSVLIIVLGVPICTRAARLRGKHDPGEVVYDEVAAFPLVFSLVPLNGTTAIFGFLWFRLFDIWKPWPCRPLDRLPSGLGIMIDDLAAGVYAAAALWATHWAWNQWV